MNLKSEFPYAGQISMHILQDSLSLTDRVVKIDRPDIHKYTPRESKCYSQV